MIIAMRKFGERLDSRPAGREAWLGFQPVLEKNANEVVVDFEGVPLLTPSFADEFLRLCLSVFPAR